jgi:hypothetical protein
VARIDRDRSLGEQRHAERAERTVDRRVDRSRGRLRQLPEEHVARILVEQRARFRRMRVHPARIACIDAGIARELAAVDQHARD